jgi:hypothetical protein
LRLHTNRAASDLAAALDADAFTVGADVFFRQGAYNPGTTAGLFVLAHEAAHAVHQSRAPGGQRTDRVRISRPGDAGERAADRIAERVVRGERAPSHGPRVAVRRLAETDAIVVQRHGSWEHRLLGDARPADLNEIAHKRPKRDDLLRELRSFLWLWGENPDRVTEEMITRVYPHIRTLRLKGSGLLVTYGELNTLPDSEGKIFRRLGAGLGTKWEPIAGEAHDIGAGADGSVWIIGSKDLGGDSPITRWNGTDWDALIGWGCRVSVGLDGSPWAVNALGHISRFIPNAIAKNKYTSLPVPGVLASDIGLGTGLDIAMWAIGKEPLAGQGEGRGIYHWSGGVRKVGTAPFGQVPGAAVTIAVGTDRRSWIAAADGTISRWVPN